MKVLLDENLPVRLKRDLGGHQMETMRDMRWLGKQNGELLCLMVSNGIDFLLTMDKNMRHQQALANFDVRIILLTAFSNEYHELKPLTPQVLAYMESGQFEKVRVITP